MDLSIIIVSYNVKYFLEQCLHAVNKASGNISSEIFVVDNNSADGSAQMVAEKFPRVHLLSNTDNVGFARANNQAIRMAGGKFILLLNPDTLVQEDAFDKCLAYMKEEPAVGCLGVKMIDGKGRFLPESKRSLPTPGVAFYKIFGLSALFPRSRRFGRYHLGFLDPDQIHEVEVISGAFMLLRQEALKKAGLLDETFFMYGEDIDLSFRIHAAGFRNIYFPLTTIIHYKGESTKKGSINYVLMFYMAMIIFARKHFVSRKARVVNLLIHLAIYFRAVLSIMQRFLRGILNPFLDGAVVYTGYILVLPLWERHLFGPNGGVYPPVYINLVVPVYIGVWILVLYLTTGYEKIVRLTDMAKSVVLGSLIILLAYALLPESLRFSRALILFGSLLMFLSALLIRLLLGFIFPGYFRLEVWPRKKRIVIIGNLEESKRVFAIIRQTEIIPQLIGTVNPTENKVVPGFVGHIGQINEIVHMNQVDEMIFCGADLSSQKIITTMLQFTDTGIEYKIAPPQSTSVIGSNSKQMAGELYVLHFNTLSRNLNRRKKRLLDIALSILFFVISPVCVLFVRNKAGLIRNCFTVMFGMHSWVGYYRTTGGNHPGLPPIKPGILTPYDGMGFTPPAVDLAETLNLNYAKDYRVLNDLYMIVRSFKQLGRRPV
jgi:GT2 family glycosyltransferase